MAVAFEWGEKFLVGFLRRKFGGSLLLLCLHQTLEFDAITTSLVEGGIEMFVACGGCWGGVG